MENLRKLTLELAPGLAALGLALRYTLFFTRTTAPTFDTRRSRPLRPMIIDQKQQQGAVKASFPAQRDWSETSSDCRARLRQIANTVPLLIRFCGPDGRWIFFNRYWLSLTGRTPDQELGCGWIEGLHPDDRPLCLEAHSSALSARQPFWARYRLRLADGGYRWIVDTCLPMFEPDGGFAGLVSIGTAGPPPEPREAALPTTWETRAAESGKACEEREQRIQAFMDHTPTLAFMKDARGRYVYVNRAFERLFGARVLGRTDFDLLPQSTAKQLQYDDLLVLASGEPRQFVEAVPTPDGAPHDWLVVKFPFRDAHGASYVGTITDITEQRRSQEQLRAFSSHLQDTLEIERARIAQEIHDELGALLTAIKMDLSFCLEEAGATKSFLSEKLYQAMTRVDTAAQAVRKIAAGLRPSILDDFGLWAAIEWLAQDFQERTGIPCELSMDVLHVSVRRDRATAIFRILQEALTNVARHAQASRVSITVQAPGNDLRVEVTDNGKGIPSERIHDPQSFGLRGMFERAAVLGGEVRIHGTPGQGTRVAIRLPLEETRGEKP